MPHNSKRTHILHISALPLWPMAAGAGMSCLNETLRGHLRGGFNVSLVVPQYNLFSGQPIRVSSERQEYDIHVARCSWFPAILKIKQTILRVTRRAELPYVLRWTHNIALFLLTTLSLFLAASRLRHSSRSRYDIVYAHNQYAAGAGWLVGRLWGIPNVTRLYGTFLASLMRLPFVKLRYPVAAAGFLVPHDLLICANDGTQGDRVAGQLGVDLTRLRFWQDGVNPHLPDLGLTRARFVDDHPIYGLRPEAKWILSCSRLSYWKRIDRILRAFAASRQTDLSAQLLIAGDGPERGALAALADELNVADDVVWLGPVPHGNVWQLMQLADVFMITNDVTNRCNPLYEAMCAGLPVVSVRDPSSADLVEQNVNGLLADRDNAEELGECLRKALTDDKLAARLRAAQVRKAAGLWSWAERMAAEVQELELLVKESVAKGPRDEC